MNVHERLLKTLNHEEPDRVPTMAQILEYGFIQKVYNTIGTPNGQDLIKMKEPMLNAAIHLGYDAIWYHYEKIKINRKNKPEIPEEIKKAHGVDSCDDWGRCYENEWYKDGVLKTPELIEEWISYMKTWESAGDVHYKRFKKIRDQYLEKNLVCIPTSGAVAYAIWSMVGMDKFAYMIRKHLTLIKKLANALGRITKDLHSSFFEQGIDMVFICDDWAMKEKCLYNPIHWNEIITPVYKELAENAHKYDAKFLVHSDGNITETLPYLIDSGADAIEPLEPESGIELKLLKEYYGDKISLIGNISATHLLTYGSKEEIINSTKQQILDAAPGGGYILAAGSDVLETCRYENVKLMIDTVKEYGKYPIDL